MEYPELYCQLTQFLLKIIILSKTIRYLNMIANIDSLCTVAVGLPELLRLTCLFPELKICSVAFQRHVDDFRASLPMERSWQTVAITFPIYKKNIFENVKSRDKAYLICFTFFLGGGGGLYGYITANKSDEFCSCGNIL